MPFLFLLDAAREHDMGGQCCHVAPIRCASLDYIEKLRGKYNGRVYVCAWTRIVLDTVLGSPIHGHCESPVLRLLLSPARS